MKHLPKASLASLLVLMTSTPLFAQTPQTFSVGQISAKAGQKASGFLEVTASVDEGTRIPIISAHGTRALCSH